MMMMKVASFLGALASLPAAALADIRDHSASSAYNYETSMTSAELEAFRGVQQNCEQDVERLCGETTTTTASSAMLPLLHHHPFFRPEEQPPLFSSPFHHPMLRSTVRMMESSSPPPPPSAAFSHPFFEEDDFGSFIDHFMNSAIHQFANLDVPSVGGAGGDYVVIVTSDNTRTAPEVEESVSKEKSETEGEKSSSSFSRPQHEELVQHVLTQFFDNDNNGNKNKNAPATVPVEHAQHVLHRVSDHAQQWVDQRGPDATALQRRMARRLSEVSLAPIHKDDSNSNSNGSMVTSFLPFTPSTNKCLRQAYQQQQQERRLLGPSCTMAMARLEHVRAAQHMRKVHTKQVEETMLSNVALLYFLVLCTLVILFVRRGGNAGERRRLRTDVLRAVYSQPYLKQAVEKELGVTSIGHAPPLSLPALLQIGSQRKAFGRVRCFLKSVRMVTWVVLCVLMFVAPYLVLPFCIALSAMLCVSALCAPKPTDSCTCCCCGTCTDDVKKGLVDPAAACCGCCKGTGVCSASCKDCCGPTVENEKTKSMSCCEDCCCCGSDVKTCKNPATDGGCCGDCCCRSSNGCESMAGGCCDDCCCCSSDDKMGSGGCCDDCCCCSSDGKMGSSGCCDDCCCCSSDGKMGSGGCCDDCGCCSTKNDYVRMADIKGGAVYEGIPVQIV